MARHFVDGKGMFLFTARVAVFLVFVVEVVITHDETTAQVGKTEKAALRGVARAVVVHTSVESSAEGFVKFGVFAGLQHRTVAQGVILGDFHTRPHFDNAQRLADGFCRGVRLLFGKVGNQLFKFGRRLRFLEVRPFEIFTAHACGKRPTRVGFRVFKTLRVH